MDALAPLYKRKSAKMKELLTVISLLVSGVVSEAPYPASGWRPSGPAFELPQRVPAQTPQQYLPPPLDPRIPPNDPNTDVSVQGLPTQEQLPIFQPSPINGQQYVGSRFNSDIQNLDVSFRQSQFENQQKIAREFEKQRQLDAAQSANSNRIAKPLTPRQFVQKTTIKPTTTTEETTQVTSTTDNSLNEGEILNDDSSSDSSFARQKVSVEKQNIQEISPELFLSPLAQLRYQPQLVPLQQFGQLKSEQQGFDGPAHFSALASVLAQQQFSNQQFQSQQAYVQSPNYLEQQSAGFVIQNPGQLNQYQISSQYQPLVQYQAQPVIIPQKVNQDQERSNDDENDQSQLVQTFQPQVVQTAPSQTPVQPQAFQPAVYQPQNFQPVQPQFYQSQAFQPGYQPQENKPIQLQVLQFGYQSQENQQTQPQAFQPGYQPQENQPILPQAYQPGYQPQENKPIQPQVFQPGYQSQGNHPIQPQAFQPGYQSQGNQPIQPQVSQPGYQSQENQLIQPQAFQPGYQPQENKPIQPQFYQQALVQGQLIAYPQNFNYPLQPQKQVQGSLQSGLEGQDQDNGIEQKGKQDKEGSEDNSSNDATATKAFGTRTQPRVFTRYGAPAPVPSSQTPEQTTTESTVEEVTEDGSAIAEATAVARGGRRKSAKLRSRRIRPVFTLDQSGHLVLDQSQ